MEIAQIIELNIDDLTQEGQGVGKFQGFTVFCANTIPGDRVLARIEQLKPRYAQAVPVEFRQRSSRLAAAPCAFFRQCGGCRLQEINYPDQLVLKNNWVEQILKRIGHINCHSEIIPSEPWNYRNKALVRSFVWNNQIRLAYLQENSHLPARQMEQDFYCHILAQDLNIVLQQTEKLLNQFRFPPQWLESILVRQAPDSGEMLLLFQTNLKAASQLTRIAETLQAALPKLVSVWQQVKNNPPVLLAGQEEIMDKLLGLQFKLAPFTFYQVNQKQAARLYQLVAEFIKGQKDDLIIDAYCGIGTISLYLAALGMKVIGVEDFAQSVAKAKENASLNHLSQVQFRRGKSEVVLPALLKKGISPKAVVLDPPRSGCASKLLNSLISFTVPQIVYVSCNPATLARDLRILLDGGYALQKIRTVDMFAQTGHVETVVLLFKGEIDSKRIRAEFPLDDMEITSFREKPTYPRC